MYMARYTIERITLDRGEKPLDDGFLFFYCSTDIAHATLRCYWILHLETNYNTL